MKIDERRIMLGTHGELWFDGDQVAETYKFQAKVNLERETISMCGSLWPGRKLKAIEGKGSIGLFKVSSRMARKIGQALREGRDLRFTIVSKLADPDAFGAERVAVKDVALDDLTLADWEAAVTGKVECPFTFCDFEFLDYVGEDGQA